MAESWSFHFQGKHPERRYRSGRVQYHDGPFRGWMEGSELRPGFHLYRITGISTHRYELAPKGVMQRGSLVLGNMLGGAGCVMTGDAEDQSWRDDRNFFALTPETPVSYHIQPGRTWSTVGLVLEPQALAELTAGDDLPGLARNAIDGKSRPFSMMRPLDGPATAQLADDLINLNYQGRMGELYRQAKSMEFLARLLDLLDTPADARALSAREKMRIREARERLLADLRNPPDLHELAHSVGLSAKRLNQGFRAVFGTTVFDHLRDARLDRARQLIAEGSDMPLKQLAWEMGYSHPTNFISAYRRRFGISPARHRRDRFPDD